MVSKANNMNQKKIQAEESWESDAVWELLKASPPIKASPRFADNTLRSARTSSQKRRWWSSIFAPAPLAGLTATFAAAVAIAYLNTQQAAVPHHIIDSAQAAEIEEIAETETLIAAVDHMEEFSDSELINLMGF